MRTELPEGVLPFELLPEDDVNFNRAWKEEQDDKMSPARDEILRLHYKFGHVSFAKIRFMTVLGWVDN